MDVEPIYMAEQIRVPPDLADILKAYTKEVIRRQPEDLYEFSAIYFANLANVSQSLEDFVPPAVDELRVVWSQLKAFETIDTPQFVEFCRSAGLSESTLLPGERWCKVDRTESQMFLRSPASMGLGCEAPDSLA